MPEIMIKNNRCVIGNGSREIFCCKRSFSWLMTLSFFFLFLNTLLVGQNTTQRPSRQGAMDAFNRGDYEAAYTQFTGLLGIFPKDPLYKYYTGVCLVKLEKDPDMAASLLADAAAGSGTVKPVPADVWFWLGRAQQMTGMFDEAVVSYNKFASLAGKKSAREMNVPDYIREASERKGRSDMTAAASGKGTGKPSDTPVKLQGDNSLKSEIKEVKVSADIMEPAPPEIDEKLSKLLSDTTVRKDADGKKTEVTDNQVSNVAAGKISDKPVAAIPDTIRVTQAVSDKTKENKSRLSDMLNAGPAKTGDSIPPTVTRKKPVYSLFEITDKPKTEKIPVNPAVPAGLIYRIQVAIFRNPVSPSYFKGLSPVEGFRSEGSDLTVYYAGLFRKASDASQALPKVRSHGFRDAFVVALMDKKQVSAERASVLEKEWGSKPLFEEDIEVAYADTVPPTLVFRVELLRSQKPLDNEKIGDISKLAGDRGLDILTDEKKQNIYLIGIFLTYKSATEYADLLVRNGYKDARVVAYLGKKEIPVDVARKLFEEY